MGGDEDDYYGILRVSPDADSAAISSAYRKLALQYHPDKYRGDDARDASQRFAKISEAYRLLTDTAARAAFDRVRRIQVAARERREQLDARRRALRDELLSREEESRRIRAEAERLEAEKALEREVARIHAEAAKKEREEMVRRGLRVYSEEELCLRYTLFDKNINIRSMYGEAKCNPGKDGTSGTLVFPSIEAARSAMSRHVANVVLEWVSGSDPDGRMTTSEPTKSPYETMTEDELERFTLNRLQRLANMQ